MDYESNEDWELQASKSKSYLECSKACTFVAPKMRPFSTNSTVDPVTSGTTAQDKGPGCSFISSVDERNWIFFTRAPVMTVQRRARRTYGKATWASPDFKQTADALTCDIIYSTPRRHHCVQVRIPEDMFRSASLKYCPHPAHLDKQPVSFQVHLLFAATFRGTLTQPEANHSTKYHGHREVWNLSS